MPAKAKAKASPPDPGAKPKSQPKKGDAKKADPKSKADPKAKAASTPKAAAKRAASDGADNKGSSKKGRTWILEPVMPWWAHFRVLIHSTWCPVS